MALSLDTYSSYQAGLIQVVPGINLFGNLGRVKTSLREESHPGAAISSSNFASFTNKLRRLYLSDSKQEME